MSDFEDEHSVQSIEDLLRRKAELEEINSGLATRLQDGEKIKSELRDARRDSQKLIHHREKLKHRVDEHSQGFVPVHKTDTEKQHVVLKSEENSQAVGGKTENVVNVESKKDEESNSECVQLRRELNALRLENASLVKEKRKTDEQKGNLVQELADLNTKHEKLQSLCDKLKEEIGRLSSFLGRSSTEKRSTDDKEDIEVLKAQLRLYQEEMNGMQAQIQISKLSNDRLRAEINEARAVIQDLRKPPPFEVYPTTVYRPVYRTYEDRYGYDRLGYNMIRSASGGYIAPVRDEFRRHRSAPQTKNLFMPDLNAVVDYGKEVQDSSLVSSQSF